MERQNEIREVKFYRRGIRKVGHNGEEKSPTSCCLSEDAAEERREVEKMKADENDYLSSRLSIAISAKELTQIQSTAAELGLKVSEFARFAIFHFIQQKPEEAER